jgi:phage repressor protein C with HTH and peptisase S24 domain
MDGGDRNAEHTGSSGCTAKRVDDEVRILGRLFHAKHYAMIASFSQAPLCDNRFCAPHAIVAKGAMEKSDIRKLMKRRGWRQVDLAEALGITQDKVAKSLNGIRQWQGDEVGKLIALLGDHDNSDDHPEQIPVGHDDGYVEVAVLPSYAGMGGGGIGEGEQAVARLSRRLIEDELRGRAHDFELVDVRGDSMEPDFKHGDQILIDRRDRDPRQPGPFALWDEDGYVIKLVERSPGKRGWYRVFSANERYSEYEIEETEVTIRGRPVWFARRL